MGASYKRYSVYMREDDTPVIIFQSAERCAAAIGCAVSTFRSYLSRQRCGIEVPKQYAIYEDEVSAEDRKLLRKENKPKLTDTDLRIVSLLLTGLSQTEVDRQLGFRVGITHYHCKKILRATGLDPRRFPELAQLKTILKIEPKGE